MQVLSIEFTDSEIAVIEQWRSDYLSSDMPDNLEGAVRDMLRRISDDIKEMEMEYA